MTFQKEYDGQECADLADSEDPIESSINQFFDVFAGQANLYNETVNSLELVIGIQRPLHSPEFSPADSNGRQWFVDGKGRTLVDKAIS